MARPSRRARTILGALAVLAVSLPGCGSLAGRLVVGCGSSFHKHVPVFTGVAADFYGVYATSKLEAPYPILAPLWLVDLPLSAALDAVFLPLDLLFLADDALERLERFRPEPEPRRAEAPPEKQPDEPKPDEPGKASE